MTPAGFARQVAQRGWRAVRRRILPSRPPPAHIERPHGRLRPGAHPETFVLVCGPGFDQRVPNASTTSRLGWCQGFESLGIPYALVEGVNLADVLPRLPNPLVWLSRADHAALDTSALRALARHPHAVMVDPAFDNAERCYSQLGLPLLAMGQRDLARVLSSQPRFVFTISPSSGFHFYEHWLRTGVPLLSLPLACDTSVYTSEPDAHDEAQGPVEMAFVGGYWRYKARQFAQYLQPYAARLTVHGYSPWPYGHYGGQLAREHEAALYRQARLSPVINEPHVSLMGIDLNERVFKVMGSGGLALTDATPAYRDWFGPDELFVPGSVAEYRDFADALLAGEIDTREQRRRGGAAVQARHTYRHRAVVFRDAMQGVWPGATAR